MDTKPRMEVQALLLQEDKVEEKTDNLPLPLLVEYVDANPSE